ncbi:MAG: hypothetical protein KH046_11970 [Stenotrophomonas maltophilia]|uniref:hypothetical protein n=1 Tax=Stenotrophomonas maltophilia TaxID=40324 RepID=UPI0013DBF12D|nr:hypothetical protein [Stenotrophomonas maltophilia]MBS4801543.1 hypothetical protein [Stenotrophomonas maltophilia]
MRVAVSPPASDSSASLSHRELARNEGANVESSSDCGAGIFIGCFFDGARNHRLNYHRLGNKTESNISRLFEIFNRDFFCFPGYQVRVTATSYSPGYPGFAYDIDFGDGHDDLEKIKRFLEATAGKEAEW